MSERQDERGDRTFFEAVDQAPGTTVVKRYVEAGAEDGDDQAAAAAVLDEAGATGGAAKRAVKIEGPVALDSEGEF